MAKKVYKIELG